MVSSTYLELYDGHRIELRGDGDLKTHLEEKYSKFESDSVDDPDLTISFGKINKTAETILGDPKKHRGRVDNQYLFKDGGNKILANSDWSQMWCSSDRSNWRVPDLIEGEVRKDAIKSNRAMIHASGVEYNGKTVLFPAWRHTGKTNTMLELVSNGAEFLSDDRLWVTEDGETGSFPVPVNLLPYNFRSFPQFQPSIVDQSLGKLSQIIDSHASDKNSKVIGGIRLLNEHFIRPESNYTQLSELFPHQQFEGSTDIDTVILLQTISGGPEDIEIVDLGENELVTALSQINHKEWNELLENIYSSFDMLFPDHPSQTEKLYEMKEKEKQIFQSVAANCETYKLYVPREEHWSEKTKQTMIDSIETVL